MGCSRQAVRTSWVEGFWRLKYGHGAMGPRFSAKAIVPWGVRVRGSLGSLGSSRSAGRT